MSKLVLRHPLLYKNKNLHLMEIDLGNLAKKVLSPFYVYSRKRVSEKIEQFQKAFGDKTYIHYAMKANFNPELLKYMAKEGLGVDVVSGGEIKRALACGFHPRKIIFSGVAKSSEDIHFALKKNILIFNIESPGELTRIGQIATALKKCAQVSFRLNPNVDAKTHPYITTGFKENKFGMDKSFLPELLKILKTYKKNLMLVGIDFHIGSNLSDSKPFEEAALKIIPIYQNLKTLGYPLKYFDIGGGIGIPYQGEKTFDLEKYARKIKALLRPLDCEIITEPGRFLVGDAGVLITKIEYIKMTPHKTFLIVNTGMHHLLRPALYQAHHEIWPVQKSETKLSKVDVVGPICESSDWLAKDRKMPQLQEGNFLAICDVGAYGFVMASDYNLHKKPEELFL